MAYIRSGTDADQFNIQVSNEVRSELLGSKAPRPGIPVKPDIVPIADRSFTDEALVGKASVFVESVPADENWNEPETRANDVFSFTASADAELDDKAASVADSPVAAVEIDAEMFADLYPGGLMNPRYWSDPQWAGNMPYGGPTIPDGFEPVDASDMSIARGNDERGLFMRIPAIELDANVDELEILDLGDSRAWSTPNRVVGHIPDTANPGEPRSGWYFGHLDNFISNEGDIFRRLPQISEMIKYDPVDIFVRTAEAEYLYRVTGTRQVHQDDLSITDANEAQIVLVTCWPFRVYDHRVVVYASLIAVKTLG